MKKNYNERTIRDEIGYKIKTIDATRHNRIFASKRLYRYSQRWEVVFFSMNIGCILNPGHGKIPAPDFNFYIQKDKYPI